MTPALADHSARALGLALRGALHEGPDSILLFGPDEPGFWPLFQSSPEAQDGAADPLDRWSKRVLRGLAADWQGEAVFPSDRPFPPFLSWATQSGAAWPSPVGLLVHDQAGLFLSFRGAIRLPGHLTLPDQGHTPCAPCPAPCTTACPVGAMTPQGYDVPACKAHVRSPEGADCKGGGCLVRRACPVAKGFKRLAEQSAFHMAAFAQE